MCIKCLLSKKGSKYFCLVYNDVVVSFDRFVIERVAMTVGVSNIELSTMNVGDVIKI